MINQFMKYCCYHFLAILMPSSRLKLSQIFSIRCVSSQGDNLRVHLHAIRKSNFIENIQDGLAIASQFAFRSPYTYIQSSTHGQSAPSLWSVSCHHLRKLKNTGWTLDKDEQFLFPSNWMARTHVLLLLKKDILCYDDLEKANHNEYAQPFDTSTQISCSRPRP